MFRIAVLFAFGCTTAPGADAAIDAASFDAGVIEGDGGEPDLDAGADAGPLPPSGPVLYPNDRRHSPITADIASALRSIAGGRETFSKMGDSITVDPSFLHCFAGSNVDLDGRPLQDTLDRLGPDPFARDSECATSGWSANAPLAGDPSPLDRELAANMPRLGVVMYGTNDVGFRDIETYARNMIEITDTMIARGAIPILSSIPPRDDDATIGARVPRWNLVVRSIAQSRGVPFVDLHRELLPLVDHGLASDGVHPRAFSGGACVLTAEGLTRGTNVRNLVSLEALDRALAALDSEALDADAPRLAGRGTTASPFEIALWPFASAGDTRAGARERAQYSGCAATQDESGPEIVYRFTLDAPDRVAVTVLSGEGTDVDVHLLDASATEGGCIARDNRTVEVDLDAGTYFVVADTFVSSVELAGDYLILAERL
jgi:hypothetical protein